MPQVIDENISRKDFLIKSLKIGGAIVTWNVIHFNALGKNKYDPVHFALLSDTHVRAYQNEQYRGFFSRQKFRDSY